MSVQASVSERAASLPNTHYMTLFGVLLFVLSVGFQIMRMDVEAGLTASLGAFFVAIGLISYGLLWLLGWLESS